MTRAKRQMASQQAQEMTGAVLSRFSIALLYLSVITLFYLLSIHLYYHYYLGDQEHYTNFWHAVQGVSIDAVSRVQLFYTGSAEPGFGYTVWLAASYFPENKEIFFSLLNSVLVFHMLYIWKIYKIPLVVVAFLLTNFYFLVLLIPAERLKTAFIVAGFALYLKGYIRHVALLLSLIFHLQMVLILSSILMAALHSELRNLIVGKLHKWRLLLATASVITVFTVFIILSEQFFRKFSRHSKFDLSDTLDTLILLVGAVTICRCRFKILFAFAPLVVASFVVGEERVTMISFAIFLYFFLDEGRVLNPFFLIILAYFSLKSISFFENVYLYNSAF